jgi:arabinan endo-1,5-alpha-L-arabinosidase
MTRRLKSFGILVWLAAFALRGIGADFEPLPAEGDTFIHDPSTIIKAGANYFVFGTGRNITTKSSPDLIHWTRGAPVFAAPPVWTTNLVPGFRGIFWAPDVIRVNGKFLLYYAVSTLGQQVSAIGLATSPTLNPEKDFPWTDAGVVITSTNESPYNTIDPSVMRDADGRLWLAFGSFWQGIFLTELNPATGLRLGENSPIYHLAWNHSIEASCLTRHGDFYYLFVNWGKCCLGTNSTYEVRLGRSKTITGPYLDREGNNLADGGGSVFLHSQGRFIGPGHIGIVIDDNRKATRFSYHYYDAATRGRSRLAVGKIDWSSGWPVPVN